jgi:hypothetical protein
MTSYWRLSITKSEKNTTNFQIYIFGFWMGSHEFIKLVKDLCFTSNFIQIWLNFLRDDHHLTHNWHWLKTIPIQKMDKPSQMCSIVMQNIKIEIFWLRRVVKHFKLNVFVRKKRIRSKIKNEKWKLPSLKVKTCHQLRRRGLVRL